MAVRFLIEYKKFLPCGTLFACNRHGVFGWTSITKDALDFDTEAAAQAYIKTRFYIGGAADVVVKSHDLPP